MLVSAARGELADARFEQLERFVEPGDVLVVNDAAAMPAAIGVATPRGRCEARLLRAVGSERFDAVLLGEGEPSQRTEDRPEAPRLERGDVVTLDGGVEAAVTEVDPRAPRRVQLALRSEASRAWSALYRAGRPIQYAYAARPLALWDVQTFYASRPWASEMPSAGWPMTFALLGRLRARGAEVVRVTHGAGLSSTGDPALDLRLPLPERYAVDEVAARGIRAAREAGGRVIAVGTSVVRALESAAVAGGALRAGEGVSELRLDGRTELRVTDVVLTGMHEAGTSHFELLEAFAPRSLLERALRHGSERGYLLHEHGDSMWVESARARARHAKVA